MAMSKFLRKRDMYLSRLSKGRRPGKPDNIGTAILTYRLKTGLTQEQLACLLGCTRAQICSWERGRYTPMKSRLNDIKKRISIIETHYCEIGDCNEEAERAHLITRAVLPKELWEDERFFSWMCRRHHTEFHQRGVTTFCTEHGLEKKLAEANQALANFTL